MASSYGLLIPGLVSTLFSLNIGFNNTNSLQKATDNTFTFFQELNRTGGWLGSVCLVIFAMAVPVVKLLLFALSEVWKRSSDKSCVAAARMCIITLQLISKWACPDMFAYILMLYLVRTLNHPPMLQGLMQLDLGFTCFSVFCIGSTVSSLGLRLPPLDEQRWKQQPGGFASKVWELHARANRFLGARGTLGLTLVSFGLLAVGTFVPCMALRLDVGVLVENGFVPKALEGFVVDTLRLPELARADVSIWKCMVALADWTIRGDLNSLVALIMLAFFVLLMTIVDMLLVCVQAAELGSKGQSLESLKSSRILFMSNVAKKLAMLDVLVMGVVVVVLCGSVYKNKGLRLSMRWGMAFLLAAELCRHAAHFLTLRGACAPATTAPGRSNSELESEDGADSSTTAQEPAPAVV